MEKNSISDLALRRLPGYIQFLRMIKNEGKVYTSAAEIARYTGVHHTQVRKDLALTGVKGIPKVGHQIEELIRAIKVFLNWDNISDAFLIGAGSLGTALLKYPGFEKAGIKIVAAFDVDKRKIGKVVNGINVFSIEKLPNLAARLNVHIGIICTSADQTIEVATSLKKHGFMGIWNFTPTAINLGEDMIIENVDIYPSLAVLCHRVSEIIKRKV